MENIFDAFGYGTDVSESPDVSETNSGSKKNTRDLHNDEEENTRCSKKQRIDAEEKKEEEKCCSSDENKTLDTDTIPQNDQGPSPDTGQEVPSDISVGGFKEELNKLYESSGSELTMEGVSIENVMNYLREYIENCRVTVKQISCNGCLHEVALPPNATYTPLKEDIPDPARVFPFALDPFQKEAILCLENNESVLVSAHTSSGKTVVAEYSIALALKANQRVIYTTPIKALSNQKYREFQILFKDVGLVTGDVTLNYDASCLIMTTEILRNMLYRGSQILREVSWVIFDEIHYMRDKERGVVWEETLILLPDNVHSVFLSATIPNATQFAEWVACLHNQPCHVVYTDVRPVPLEHYIYPIGDSTMYMVIDEFGVFKDENFNSAMNAMGNKKESANNTSKKFSPQTGGKCCDVIRLLTEKDYTPMIVFSFSKKECEFYAVELAKRYKVKDDVRDAVTKIFNNALCCLSEVDQKLPQISSLLFFLQKGIGIHHGGLLPILKEVVEILFSEGLLAVLFATETFAMGLNMPARTVMFTSFRKFDGKEMRFITSGEYIQMSGRAGRRGLDKKGTAILLSTEPTTPEQIKGITQGQADELSSAFHLTYNMILNLTRIEDINPEYMLEKSFHQFQNQGSIPALFETINKMEKELADMRIENEQLVAEYFEIRKKLSSLGDEFRSLIFAPSAVAPWLQPGRLVRARPDDGTFVVDSNDENTMVYDWGMVLNYHRKEDKYGQVYLVIDVLMSRKDTYSLLQKMEVVQVKNDNLRELSSLKIKYPKNLRSEDNKQEVYKMIQETKRRFMNRIPLLNPVDDMHIKGEKFEKVAKAIRHYESKLYSHPLQNSPDLDKIYTTYCKKVALQKEVEEKKTELKKQVSSSFLGELSARKRVLRRMKYCTEDDIILKKGQVACELSSGQELLLTELMFNGIFNDLTVSQCVAVLSCLLCDERSNTMPKLTDDLSGPLSKMTELVRQIAKISKEAHLDIDEDVYVSSVKPHLMDACYAWSNGAAFSDVCKLTDIFEGSIIRCLRRMEEMLRQLVQATQSIGEKDLEQKFTDAINSIKRGIVFAASLYL